MKLKTDSERVTWFVDYLVNVLEISEKSHCSPEIWAQALAMPTLTINEWDSFHFYLNHGFYIAYLNIFMCFENYILLLLL